MDFIFIYIYLIIPFLKLSFIESQNIVRCFSELCIRFVSFGAGLSPLLIVVSLRGL